MIEGIWKRRDVKVRIDVEMQLSIQVLPDGTGVSGQASPGFR